MNKCTNTVHDYAIINY